jgi:hypothetical protein
VLGRLDEGLEYVQRLLAISPDTSVSRTKELFGRLVRRNPRPFEIYFDGLRRCGLPEGEHS